MASRLTITTNDRVQLWRQTAKLKDAVGATDEAKHARWVAANIRSPFPTKRPEEM